jgi:hypothetical protein
MLVLMDSNIKLLIMYVLINNVLILSVINVLVQIRVNVLVVVGILVMKYYRVIHV